MILKASQRSGARSFANHLLNKRENDHVEVYDIRGLAAEKLHGAFLEIDAVSKGTRATQPFFVVAFNPPENANVSIDQFEAAIAKVEKKLSLVNQPRAIVFHEKEGRRHAHVVWSRIVHEIDPDKGTDKLKAINMPHFKSKLQDLQKELYKEHGWKMPRGLANKGDRDPLNFDLQTWQQAKRLKEDPRDLKNIIQEALKRSDGANAFAKALKQHGLHLAQGVRGKKANFVVVHHSGEVMSLTRYAGLKSKDLTARLGGPENLPPVEEVQKTLETLKAAFSKFKLNELKRAQKKEREPLKAKLIELRDKQRAERKTLKEKQKTRWQREELARAKRLRKGIRGLWDRLTGHRGKVIRQNKKEMEDGKKRDKTEKQKLIDRHLEARRKLQDKFKALKLRHNQEMAQIRLGIGSELKGHKGKLKKAWQEKGKPRKGKSLSENWKDSSGSRSGGGKAPPVKEAFNEQTKKPGPLKEKFNEWAAKQEQRKERKQEKEKDRDEGRGRERTRPPGPGGGPGR